MTLQTDSRQAFSGPRARRGAGQRYFWLRVSQPIVGRLPWLFYPAAAAAGTIAWTVKPRTRRDLTRNLLPFCGRDRTRAIREGRRAYRNLARYWVDLCTLPYRDMSRFEHECIRLVHPERLHPLEAEGPVMLVSAHMGNPELGLQAITFRGRRFTALVENVQPPEMGRFLNRLRSAAGGRFHVASLGGVRAVIEALQAGEVVGMMADRDLQGTGVPVQLAGRRVLLPSGPWEIARRTNATVIPVFAARTWRDRFTMSVEEPFSVPALGDGDVAVQCAAQRFATLMEAHIRRAPGQWAILEDFWQVHRCGKG